MGCPKKKRVTLSEKQANALERARIEAYRIKDEEKVRKAIKSRRVDLLERPKFAIKEVF